MNSEVLKEIYANVLNDSQKIRKEIMNEWGDILMFGGTMPPDVIKELTIAARITGLAFDALANHGIEVKQIAGKPDLYTLTVLGGGYICHKTAIPSMVGFLDTVNIPGVNQETIPSKKETIPEQKKVQPVPTPAPVPAPVSVPEVDTSYFEEEHLQDVTAQTESFESVQESTSHEWDDVVEPETEETPVFNEEVDNTEEYATEETPVYEESAPEYEAEVEQEVYDEPTPEPAPVNMPAPSNDAPKITSFSKADLFIEENRKAKSEIIYEMYTLSLTHNGLSGGGRPVEMQIMIAPLKIQKFATPSVPIIVSVYHKGKITTASSYDQQEDGKNLVTLCIDEFYLLFRGSFNANGEFKGLITTTGISAAQADALNVISDEKYGEMSKNVNNGHVKFRASIYDDPGTIEVFPFGYPDDNEFIIMTKTEEFVDYIYVSSQSGGMKKPSIFDNGERKEISCRWEDDYLCVDLLD